MLERSSLVPSEICQKVSGDEPPYRRGQDLFAVGQRFGWRFLRLAKGQPRHGQQLHNPALELVAERLKK
jgi:hypothetical protein